MTARPDDGSARWTTRATTTRPLPADGTKCGARSARWSSSPPGTGATAAATTPTGCARPGTRPPSTWVRTSPTTTSAARLLLLRPAAAPTASDGASHGAGCSGGATTVRSTVTTSGQGAPAETTGGPPWGTTTSCRSTPSWRRRATAPAGSPTWATTPPSTWRAWAARSTRSAPRPHLNDLGHFIARERMLCHTVNRLGYVDDRKNDPAIAEPGDREAGVHHRHAPHRHHDPARHPRPGPRQPGPAHVGDHVPVPAAAGRDLHHRPADRHGRRHLPRPEKEQIPEFKAIHPMGAELSQECVVMMGEAMITPLFHNQFRVPSYQDWVDDEADFSAVYDFHHRQLQHIQAHNAQRPLGAQDRRPPLGPRPAARDLPRRPHRVHPPRPGEVDDVLRQPHHAGARRGQRLGRPPEIAADWTARLRTGC